MAFNASSFALNKVLGFVSVKSAFDFIAHMKSRRDQPFFIFEGKTYTYLQTFDRARRYADFFLFHKKRLIDAGKMKPGDQLAVAVYMDNSDEYTFAFFGAAMSGSVIIAVNTGFRGETLWRVVNKAEAGLMLTDMGALDEVDRALPEFKTFGQNQIYVIEHQDTELGKKYQSIEAGLTAPGVAGQTLPAKIDNFDLLIVIYTSGTTGEPKGVPCTHAKLIGAGALTWWRLKLKKTDRGHISMPMFHSNAWFIGIFPLMVAGGSFVLRRKFSASAFEADALEYGVTYLNYVGQPIHYILVSLEKKYGSAEAIEQAVARHPNNRFRIAHGNGATPLDRKKLLRYFNMEHIYELYGSTEAAISTVLMPGDPIDSVGQAGSNKVVILNEHDQVCLPGKVDETGRLLNYDECVGEICKITPQDNFIFSGYYKNDEASNKKFRDGHFHSGDLGHIRVVGGKRYLFFNGRTDDWIRKDGENFSAENVCEFVFKMPGVALAAAYGAPCEIADEKVMVAVQLMHEKDIDPQAVYDYFAKQQKEGGMDPKWFPDFVRIVPEFELTHQTMKILSRSLKRDHFNLDKNPDMKIFYRLRGDTTYKPLTPEAYDQIKKTFRDQGREGVLEQG